MSEPKLPPHPGKIVLMDAATKEILNELDVATLPEAMAYAETDQGMVPIVRMEVHYRGDQRIIRKYGPDGEYLGATIQIANKPEA